MKNIIINGSILDLKPTGLGVYTNNILESLSKNTNFTLFSSVKIKSCLWIKIPKLVRPYPYKKIGGIARFLCNQTYFTYVAKKYELAYLPTPHGSLFLRNQVVTIHDLLALRFPTQHRLQFYYYRYFMPIILSKAKGIIAISESTKSDLIKFYNIAPRKIKVIHNGFDGVFFSYKKSATSLIKEKYDLSNYILIVGSSYPHKNIDKLIEAFSLTKNASNMMLAITGHVGEHQKKLTKRYHSSNIKFIGFVDNEDLPFLYSAANFMVYPSLYEGFGFPPLEAMNCRCPVLVSDTSSLPEVCGDAALYMDPYDLGSMSKAIDKMIVDESLRSDLIVKGLERTKHFNWDCTASQLYNYFDSLLLKSISN